MLDRATETSQHLAARDKLEIPIESDRVRSGEHPYKSEVNL
jgi:hypothetical protein